MTKSNSLKSGNIEYRRFDHGHIPSILAVTKSGDAPVLLMSHIVMVDGPDELFEPVEKDDPDRPAAVMTKAVSIWAPDK